MLADKPLLHPYEYTKRAAGSQVRRNLGGEIVSRTLVGNTQKFTQVEASKFLAKLNSLAVM